MRLATLPFQDRLYSPLDPSSGRTSRLLESGVFTYFQEPGLPFYLPIGRLVLERVMGVLERCSAQLGIEAVDIPCLMRDELLYAGEHVAPTFQQKIIPLAGDLAGYHLLTTPEMMLRQLASEALASHRHLPLRVTYLVDMFRAIPSPKGLLKGRQFKTYIGTSFDANERMLAESLELFGELTDSAFARMGLKTYKRRDADGIALQYYYLGSEGDNLVLPEIDGRARVKALWLAMSYHYAPTRRLGARFRAPNNRNARSLIGSYGLSIPRLLLALFDASRDKLGFALPASIRPFHVAIIPQGRAQTQAALGLYRRLRERVAGVMVDDREKGMWSRKAAFADYLGAPYKVLVQPKGLVLKDRGRQELGRFEREEQLEERLGGLLGLTAGSTQEIYTRSCTG